MTPRYPDIRVSVRSRNPLALIGAIRFALRRAGVDRREIQLFCSEAFSGEDVRQVAGKWVRVEGASPSAPATHSLPA